METMRDHRRAGARGGDARWRSPARSQERRAARSQRGELRARTAAIVEANRRDLAAAREAGRPASFLDRLMLDEKRIEGVARGLEEIAALPDPVGAVIARWTRPNGLSIERVRVPLGVVGIIYESRPNVTADAGRAVPQGRQRRDPARRLGKPPFEPRHPRLPRARPRRGGPARDGRPARADDRPRGGGADAGRPRRRPST